MWPASATVYVAGVGGEVLDAEASRARAWYRGRHEAVCETLAPWEHGTIVRAARLPDYWDFNLVRVEEDPGNDTQALVAVADEALADAAHRRIEIEPIAVGERLRDDFGAMGWRTMRLLWMLHDGTPREPSGLSVAEADYDTVHELREAWHHEDFPDQDPSAYLAQARGLALSRGARVLAAKRDGGPVGFAQLEGDVTGAVVAQVYVRPEARGEGLGTALTTAAIAAAHAADPDRDLWIAADDEDRPKELYKRLGFRPVWTMLEATRVP
jgi:ribosomal protein S18 acetylase RimI-like enzyme